MRGSGWGKWLENIEHAVNLSCLTMQGVPFQGFSEVSIVIVHVPYIEEAMRG
jgi:hypothetical protein